MTSGRRTRHSLSRAEILDAAFALEEAGTEATIRAVAASIGASPMGLYAYVATKEDLLDALADRVLGLVPEPPASSDWVDATVERGWSLFQTLMAHPWAVPILLVRPNPGAAAAASGERFLSALRVGLDPATAATAFTGLLALIYGAAAFLTAPRRSDAAQDREEVVARIPRSEAHPNTEASSAALAEYGSEAQVRRSMRALVIGLAQAS